MRQSTAQMNSSEGFKRRLIRPSSSRGGERQRQNQFLKTFDVSQSETSIVTITKADLLALQQDINSIDIDKRIRTQDTTLGKTYVTNLKKWLKQVQNSQTQQEDETKVLKALNVDNVSTGFKKLWKITQCLDNLVSKSNELQAIVFLKYDELFSSLEDQNIKITHKKLNLIGQSFSVSSFQMNSVYTQRVQDLYSLIGKVKKGDKNSQSKIQLNQTKAESQKLIKELQQQNKKLNSYLEQMMKRSEQQKKTKASEKTILVVPSVVKSNQNTQNIDIRVQKSALNNAISQISASYQQQLQDLTQKLRKALDSEAHIKLEVRSLRQLIQSMKKQSKQNKPISSGMSYQATLKQEIDNMKKGFQSKISKLKDDYLNRQKELMRKENEYRVQNEKIRFQRQLLMKKYDLTK